MGSATAITISTILAVEKDAMVRLLHKQHALSDRLIARAPHEKPTVGLRYNGPDRRQTERRSESRGPFDRRRSERRRARLRTLLLAAATTFFTPHHVRLEPKPRDAASMSDEVRAGP